jgi:hypothetical protein
MDNGSKIGDKMPQEGVRWWIELMGKTAVSTTHAYLRWVSNVNLEPELSNLKQPVLVVQGMNQSAEDEKNLQLTRRQFKMVT